MADNDHDFPVTGPPWNPPRPAPGGYRTPPPPPRFQARPGSGYGHGGPGDPADPAYAGPAPHRLEMSDAAMTHYLGLAGILGPILMYVIKGPTSGWVRANAAEALNFHISMIFWSLGWILVSFVAACGLGAITNGVGFFVIILLAFVPLVVSITFSVIAGAAASRGRFYTYPLTIRMIKG